MRQLKLSLHAHVFKDSFQKILLNFDSQILAFDTFYQLLLESSSYQETSHRIQGHPAPAYNLLGHESYLLIKDWLESESKETNQILEIGCGLSPLSSLTKKAIWGIDSSLEAIKHNTKTYKYNKFTQHHNSLRFDHNCSHLVSIDALYRPKERRRGVNLLEAWFKDLKKFWHPEVEGFFIAQNLYHHQGDEWDKKKLNPLANKYLKGFSSYQKEIKIYDKTKELQLIVESWCDFLETNTDFPSKLKSNLSREMHFHQESLRKGHVQRIILSW